jgi:hypothetical protein
MKLVVLLCLLVSLVCEAEPDPHQPTPPIEFVQARVLHNLRLQDFQLEGVIHTSKKIYPMRLRTRDHEMVYEFTDQPLQIRVNLDPEQSSVARRKNSTSDWEELTGSARQQAILDTDITYEDLCLDFIHWSKVTALGGDDIKTLKSWAFEATPDGSSQYTKVRYWISSDFFAFLRVDGYNSQGQAIKRVEVNGVQKIGSAYVIKEMQISSLVPGRELSSSRTYIEVRTGQPGSGL